ncbi:protein kinase [Streptomyces sp. NPDC048560]|uniref:serine/threonine-protein kinase n=1 Tax=Streptomyces sp. NPDC048560 TaxID=3155488 RepID=UPI003425CCC1
MQITPLSPEDPTSLGDFDLLGRIGQGGMGQVFLGESPSGEPAAVKVIKPSVVDTESRLRFAQEIEVLKTIWGTRNAAFLGADPEAEQPWLATEYIAGPDLSRHCAEDGPLSPLLTASLGAILAEGLATVHQQGLLHRDLKPANILLGPNGPKIIDFGLAAFTESNASLTAPHQVVGTPACMAPEQAAGVKPLTGAVDVYALGSVLLFAATGHYPYDASHVFAMFHMITDPDTDPDVSGLPAELSPLISEMLAQDPAERPSLAQVVARFRALIEASGLNMAQARRRLTAQTSRSGLHNPVLPTPTVVWPPAPAQQPEVQSPAHIMEPADPGAGIAHLPTGKAAVAPPASPAPSAPSSNPDFHLAPTVTVPEAPGAGPTDEPAPVPQLAPTLDDDPTAPPVRTGPGRSPARPASTRPPIRHSAQARRTAAQLRTAYAAGAAF